MTTPALARLRERFPEARITLLTHEKLADLWRGHASVAAVIPFDPSDGVWRLAGRLRAEGFDAALVLPNSTRSALEPWLARIPNRIGYGGRGRSWFLTQRVASRNGFVPMRKLSAGEIKRRIGGGAAAPEKAEPLPRNAHHIFQYLHLVAALGANPEPTPPRFTMAREEVEGIAKKFGLSSESRGSRLVLGLNPGAEYGPAKRWPMERFIAAAKEIHQRTNCIWLLVGGNADVAGAEAIQSALGGPRSAAQNLAGRTSLRELMGLLSLCRAVLTNDSGPMHLAAALGVPVVAPFGSTSRELTGPGVPGETRHHLLTAEVPCSPCFRRVCPIDFRCMEGIGVERVVEAVVEAAQTTGGER
jgi:heptosyltransferase-2